MAKADKVEHLIDELARKKWQSSGLSDKEAGLLRLQGIPGLEVASRLESRTPHPGGLYIPYFDLNGKPTDFFRVRYLEPLPGFAGLVEKPQRYVQKADTINEVYLPPLLSKSWKEIANDTSIAVGITEGELKAAKACAVGLVCCGLGGVEVWRASKRGIDLLPALKEIKWKGRKVFVIFDSDAASNPNVVRAQRRLASELLGRGAEVKIVSLPAANGGRKQGLDDFLLTHHIEALHEVIQDSPGFQEADSLWEMNEEVLYVKDPGLVVERSNGYRMDPGRFVSHIFANRHYKEITIKADGSTVTKTKPLAKRWLEWEGRHEAQRMVYAPGRARMTDGGSWNTWAGWGVEPKKGDIGPWSELLDFLFAGEPKIRSWFERWCAYPIQYPGTKMYSSVMIWGRHQRTGKTLAAYMLMGVYGKNAIEIKNKDLKGGFNSWADNRQFVYGDEIAGNEARVDAEWLKGLITQKMVRINTKFMPEYSITDCINYLFTSNKPDALFLDDTDSRYLIHEVTGAPRERAFYERCDRFLHDAGPSYLMHHLLTLPLGDFNPREHAPETAAKLSMIMSGKSDLGMWVVNLTEDPVRVLAPLGKLIAEKCELFQPSLLLHAYDPDGRGKVTAPGIGRELVRAGFHQVNGARPIRTKMGLVRLYAIRNVEKWAQASPKDIRDHYDAFFGDFVEGKY